jgi:anti-sigma regulatory factor (Ser/Thr protein kinase)
MGDQLMESCPTGSDNALVDDADLRGAVVLSQTYPAVPESVPAVRATVGRFATKAGAPPSTIDAVKLAISEAATNVVVHAYRHAGEPGLIHVEATLKGRELCVSVADTGPGLRPRVGSPGLGLGLAIIKQLAEEVELLQGGNGGLRILMRFALPARAS